MNSIYFLNNYYFLNKKGLNIELSRIYFVIKTKTMSLLSKNYASFAQFYQLFHNKL